MINNPALRKAIRTSRNRTESYHQLQGTIRKVYHGIFKGKRIIDNAVSAHAIRFAANFIIGHNSVILDKLYEKLQVEKAPPHVLEKFSRISPIAWDHISFTGRYSFKKASGKINLKLMLDLLEKKLRKTLLTKDVKN